MRKAPRRPAGNRQGRSLRTRGEFVRNEIAGGDRWMELETCILEKELAALREMLK